MRTKVKIALLQILAFFGFLNGLNAQIPPNLDPNYVLNSAKSDEFNGTALNSALWSALPTMANYGWFGGIGNGAYCDPVNVVVQGGYLRLKLTAPNGPQGLFCMGQIESKYPDYDHGYFEITAKLVDPGYYENGQPNLSGIWPSFWMYYLTCATCACYHDEMDVLDNLYGDNIYVINGPPVSPSEDTKYANGGTVGRIPTNPDPNFHDCVDLVDPYYHKNDNPLFESEHTYGIEWLSNKALIYFDGNLVGTSVEALPLHTLYVLMGMQFVKGYFNYNIPLPQEYQIDYFRYYQLITNYCQTDAFITSNVELNNFVYGVRRNITIGDPLFYSPFFRPGAALS